MQSIRAHCYIYIMRSKTNLFAKLLQLFDTYKLKEVIHVLRGLFPAWSENVDMDAPGTVRTDFIERNPNRVTVDLSPIKLLPTIWFGITFAHLYSTAIHNPKHFVAQQHSFFLFEKTGAKNIAIAIELCAELTANALFPLSTKNVFI